MQDRSSRPKVMVCQTAEALAERIVTHRCQRLCGRHIAELTGVSPATVSRVPECAGLSRLRGLLLPEPIRRGDCKEPGGPIHLDIMKPWRSEKLGHRVTGDGTGQGNARGVGWEFVHVRDQKLKHVRTKPCKPKQTAKLKDSSRLPCANGPMPAPAKLRAGASPA